MNIDEDVRMQLKAIEDERMKTMESRGSISNDSSSEDESSSEEESKESKYYDYY